jgi:hypothetical protein
MFTRDRRPTLTLLAGAVFCAFAACSVRSAPKLPPVPETHREMLTSFIKHQTCAPTTCDAFTCETFSSGQTKGLPSHVARCRWADTRSGGGGPNRCAFVHYSEDKQAQGFGNLFLSVLFAGTACHSDPEFAARIKETQGYSGSVP